MNYIAFDIETVPLSQLSEQQVMRLGKDLERHIVTKRIDVDDEVAVADAKRLLMSTNWLLGRICCISVRRIEWIDREWIVRNPHSFIAEKESEEELMIAEFWKAIGKFGKSEPVGWISFNGKRFDVPFLLNRTLKNGIKVPKNRAFANLKQTKPWQKEHIDLMDLDGNRFFSLADLCDFLGVESPKSGCDGSQVAKLVADGRIKDVAKYCEADVTATLECFLKAREVLV